MILLVVLIIGFHPILGMTEVAAVKGDEDLQVCSAEGVGFVFFAGAWFIHGYLKRPFFFGDDDGLHNPSCEKCGIGGQIPMIHGVVVFFHVWGHKLVQRNG